MEWGGDGVGVMKGRCINPGDQMSLQHLIQLMVSFLSILLSLEYS